MTMPFYIRCQSEIDVVKVGHRVDGPVSEQMGS